MKQRLQSVWKHLAVPFLVGNGLFIILVLLGKDLGTTAVLMLIMIATMLVGGIELKKMLLVLVGSGLLATAAALLSPNRLVRLMSWTNRECDDGMDLCHQGLQGLYALASDGWCGVGIGQSRQKWHWIPEAHTDFIFAIIGEELGLIGSLFILALFGLLTVSVHRIALRTTTVFAFCACSVSLMWLVFQAVLNIAMVAGVVPVTAVPLTFVSFGGSSLVISLAAIGVVLAIARDLNRNNRPLST
ncbi:FtsW/RodA/SpoVE family cell cycle protein [Paeniglutamicibacter antarcticus]|uniref:FtsW/RodA/SpoVE family cell cycle protein n=1 Tax=Paeniglutamicibacter antarcticus TaxID=494023 RepID=UPI0031F1C0AB